MASRYCSECLRKCLHRWLSATRTERRRRITLKEKEEKMNTRILVDAWDKWREHFVEEKLRTMVSRVVLQYAQKLMNRKERNVFLQHRRNLLFRTFGVWHSKTKVSLCYMVSNIF